MASPKDSWLALEGCNLMEAVSHMSERVVKKKD